MERRVMLDKIFDNAVDRLNAAIAISPIDSFCPKFPAYCNSSLHSADLAFHAVGEHLVHVTHPSVGGGYLYHEAQLKQLFQVVNGRLEDEDAAIAMEGNQPGISKSDECFPDGCAG